MSAEIDDAWIHTIGLLNSRSGGKGKVADKHEAVMTRDEHYTRLFMDAYEAREVCVSVVDRPSARTATISWRDPTACCYGDQVWRAGVSRSRGVCAMSGRPILPGDAVFKPQARRPLPLNVGAMILATAVLDAVESFKTSA
jgi:hypothetical protein